jgi:transcription elongation factor Elf1
MLQEMSVDRFRFSCPHCGHRWLADYELRHVEDGHGEAWDCYSRDGHRVTAPTARGVVCCTGCGAGLVHVELISTRSAAVSQASTNSA